MAKAKQAKPAKKPARKAEASEHEAAWSIDLRNLPSGAHLGGRISSTSVCEVCGAVGARLANYQGRKRFAHTLVFHLNQKHDPVVEAAARCMEPRR